MLGRMLESKGLTLDDVTVVPLGKLSAVMAALQSGQIYALAGLGGAGQHQGSGILPQGGAAGQRCDALPDKRHFLLPGICKE